MSITPDTTLESFDEQLTRLEMMVLDEQDTWDLSEHDQAAIDAVVKSHHALFTACKAFVATTNIPRDWRKDELAALIEMTEAVGRAERT